ncbi:hypothetical protein Bca4012_085991 [Brassica carinata]
MISMKFALVIFLVVASVVNNEATRLLTEEALETVLHGESLPRGEEKIHFGLQCQKGCYLECSPNPYNKRCSCVCQKI